jgi:hypothetical protein
VQQIRHPLGHTAVWQSFGLGRDAHALVFLKCSAALRCCG